MTDTRVIDNTETDIQTCTIDDAIDCAETWSYVASLFDDGTDHDNDRKALCLGYMYAYLNRACELACVPLAQYYAESSNGNLDFVWITYRPEAILNNSGSIPGALVYLDSVDNMNEDQARARALGY